MTDEFLPQGDPAAPTHLPIPEVREEPVEISEFIEDPYAVGEVTHVAPAVDVVPQDAAPCWYCGLGEAGLWFGGTLAVHIAGGIFAVIVTIVGIMLMTGKQPTRMEDPQVMLPVTSIE